MPEDKKEDRFKERMERNSAKEDKAEGFFEWDKHKHHIPLILTIAIAVIIIIILALMVMPAMLASRFSQQFDQLGMSPTDYLTTLESTRSNLSIMQSNLLSCQELKESLVSDLADEKNVTMNCAQQKNLAELNLSVMQNSLNTEKENVQAALQMEKIRYDNLEKTYQTVVRNSANNICCKLKVDDASLDSYVVVSNKVTCTTGRETKIVC